MQIALVLEQQLQMLTQLYDLTKKEQKTLIERNTDALQAICKQKAELQDQLTLLEEQRNQLAGGRSMTELAAKNEAPDLLTYLEPMKTLLRDLHNLQTTNQLLIQNELAYWGQLKAVFFPQNTPYTAKGKLEGNKNQTRQLVTHLA